jgi:hypothetical protein
LDGTRSVVKGQQSIGTVCGDTRGAEIAACDGLICGSLQVLHRLGADIGDGDEEGLVLGKAPLAL